MTHLLRKKAAAVTIALFFMASSASSQPANGNYCGSSWMDAVSRCAKSCPSGAPTECIGGETCFAGTPVSVFSKYTYERYSAHVIHQLYVSYLFLSQCLESVPETPPPVPPLPPQGGTCGDGQVGNGVCPVQGECCRSVLAN